MAGRALPQLDLSGQIEGIHDAYHLGFYRAPRAGFQDRISQYMQDFISGIEPQSTRWIELALASLEQHKKFDYIIRALHGRETSAAEFTSLDRLGVEVAQQTNAIYAPERLEKSRETSDLAQIGGREARKLELDGVYRFDAEGIPQKARILVIDWIMMTGTTVEAIAGAIHQELPEAEVACFVLGKADHEGQNFHLNADYFVSPVRGLSAYTEDEVSVRTPSVPQKTGPVRKRQAAAAKRPEVKRSSRSVRFWAYLGTSALIFLVLGALVPLQSRKKSTDPNEIPQVNPAVAAAPEFAAPPTPAKPAAKKATTPKWPQGIVTVPGVGLRTKASIDARLVKNASLKQGQRISILKRVRPSAGPSWIKIQTRSGKTGWVFASVVKERSSR